MIIFPCRILGAALLTLAQVSTAAFAQSPVAASLPTAELHKCAANYEASARIFAANRGAANPLTIAFRQRSLAVLGSSAGRGALPQDVEALAAQLVTSGTSMAAVAERASVIRSCDERLRLTKISTSDPGRTSAEELFKGYTQKDFERTAAQVQASPEIRAQMACVQSPTACSQYGLFLMRGTATLPKDEAKAVEYFQMGCNRGHFAGCRALGMAKQGGRGGPVDLPAARAAYAKACTGRDGSGCMRLGLMLNSGLGGAQDRSAAIVAVRQACEFGEKQACAAAGTATTPPPPPAASARRALSDVEKRTCGIQYLAYAQIYEISGMLDRKPASAKQLELQRRGMAILGLAPGTRLSPELNLAVGTVRVAAMTGAKPVQDATLRTMVTTVDSCNAAQRLAAIPD